MTIADRRLVNQGITGAGRRRPADVVAWSGAVQAQEYEPAKWGVGLRMHDEAVDVEVEQAFERGQLLRTHVMRPTWHFVTSDDIRWLLELTAPRVHRMMATYNRRLELDAATLVRATNVLERALRDRHYRTRTELAEYLQRSRIVARSTRLAHLVMYGELEGVICSGPRRGKQFTYALVAERAPKARRLTREEALVELSRRYLRSHGPATIRDFVWWSGLTTADAKRGFEMNKAQRVEADGRVYWSLDAANRAPARERPAHLLPIYDEYLVAYRDRGAVPHSAAVITSASGSTVTFQHALLLGGQVAGTWRTPRDGRVNRLEAIALRRVSASERRALAEAVARYARFRGVEIELSIHVSAS